MISSLEDKIVAIQAVVSVLTLADPLARGEYGEASVDNCWAKITCNGGDFSICTEDHDGAVDEETGEVFEPFSELMIKYYLIFDGREYVSAMQIGFDFTGDAMLIALKWLVEKLYSVVGEEVVDTIFGRLRSDDG